MLHSIDADKLGPRGKAMADAVGTCVHCGFCLPACPTYQELESEMDSPRGRILLIKSVLEGDLTTEQAAPHIDRCLGCLACVTHCPSGVPYGDLISSYRDHVRVTNERPKWDLRNWLMGMTLPYAARFRAAVTLGRWTKPLQSLVPASLRPMLELVPDDLPARQHIPEFTAGQGRRRGRVAMLAGCAQQVLAPDINASAVRVLSANGIDVLVPDQGCCGALAWHTGRGHTAAEFAKKLIQSIPSDIDCFVTTAAGCGSAIHEYPLLLAGTPYQEAAERFAERSVDISVFLDRIGLLPIPALARPTRVAYHDACHLAHAQGVRAEPRRLLQQVPGLEVVELSDPDTCCGSAGTYNIEQPEIAGKLGERKAKCVVETGASAVVTGNIGCLVQIEKYLRPRGDRVAVLHTVQVLDRAYRSIFG